MATISCPQNHIRFISDSGIGSVREISAAAFTRTQKHTHIHVQVARLPLDHISPEVAISSKYIREENSWYILFWRHVSYSRSQLVRRDTVHNKIWHWSPTMKPLSQGNSLFKRREASINQTRRVGKTVYSKNNGLLYGPFSHGAICIGKSAVSNLITYIPRMEVQHRCVLSTLNDFLISITFYVLFSCVLNAIKYCVNYAYKTQRMQWWPSYKIYTQKFFIQYEGSATYVIAMLQKLTNCYLCQNIRYIYILSIKSNSHHT